MRIETVGRMLLVLAVSVLLAGCGKTFEITFTNTSMTPKTLMLDGPDGPEQIGPIAPAGHETYKVKVNKKDLPANCTMKANDMAPVSFQLNHDTKLYVYIENDRLTGPINKKTSVTSSHEFQGTHESKPQQIITGDNAGKTQTDPGGKRIVSQEPVVE